MVRNRKILFWKIKDIWFNKQNFSENKKSDIVVLHSPEILNKNEFTIVVPEKTLMIDLLQSQDDLLKNFHKTLRWSISKAKKENVSVEIAKDKKNIDCFYKFFCNFCEKREIPKPFIKEFDEYDIFIAKDKITNEYLGGCCFIKDNIKNIYRYKHGAVIYRGQENEAIIWKAIKFAKKEGYKIFDMGGVIPTTDQATYNYRHYNFKKRFGGKLENFYTYIKINNRFLRILTYIFIPIFRLIFKENLNGFINFLNQIKFSK